MNVNGAISQETIEYVGQSVMVNRGLPEGIGSETTLKITKMPLAELFYQSNVTSNTGDNFETFVLESFQVSEYLNKFQINFQNPQFIIQALCHTSFIHENPDLCPTSNQRLEFLGDAVVDLYVSQRLFKLYPEMDEGKLSKLRGALVNEEALSQMAQLIGLPLMLLLGKGETKRKAQDFPSVASDAFEALVGALHMDQGFSATCEFLDQVIKLWDENHEMSFLDKERLEKFDAKSQLQELTMAKYKLLPEYVAEVTQEGFLVECYLGQHLLHGMKHQSKKKAQREIAQYILNNEIIDNLPSQLEKGK